VEAHETVTSAEDQGTSAADGEKQGKKAKESARGFESIARQEIRRARRLVNDGQPTPEANFAVQVAGVMAMLDLAAAIREHRNGTA
jgi:hypothetical protein